MLWLAPEIHWAHRDRPLHAQVRPIEADHGIDEGRGLNYHRIALEASKTLESAIWSQAIIGLDFSKKNHMYDYLNLPVR
jgi:hypothetical protein